MPLITQAEYARQRGVSRAYINKLTKQGKIPTEGQKIDSDKADAALNQSSLNPPRVDKPRTIVKPEHRSPERAPIVAAPRTPSYLQARTYNETYKAKMAELDYKKACGQVAEIGIFQRALEKSNAIIKQKLTGLPTKMAAELTNISSTAVVKGKLESEVLEILAELKNSVATLIE